MIQGDDVIYLPAIVEAAVASPVAATESARLIRKFLSRDYWSRPACQYNAIMLIRILSDNPGPGFTRNFDKKFVDVCKDLLRAGRDSSVRQLLMETLDTFETSKGYDEGLNLVIAMWQKEKKKAYEAYSVRSPITYRLRCTDLEIDHTIHLRHPPQPQRAPLPPAVPPTTPFAIPPTPSPPQPPPLLFPIQSPPPPRPHRTRQSPRGSPHLSQAPRTARRLHAHPRSPRQRPHQGVLRALRRRQQVHPGVHVLREPGTGQRHDGVPHRHQRAAPASPQPAPPRRPPSQETPRRGQIGQQHPRFPLEPTRPTPCPTQKTNGEWLWWERVWGSRRCGVWTVRVEFKKQQQWKGEGICRTVVPDE